MDLDLKKNLRLLMLTRFMSSLGYLAIIFLLAIVLLKPPFEFDTSEIAILVGVFALTDSGVSILWVSLIPRLGFHRSLLLSSFLSSLGCFGFVCWTRFSFTLLMLILIGTGLTLGSLTTRLLISKIPSDEDRLFQFSHLFRVVNGAYALTSVLVFYFFKTTPSLTLLTSVGIIFLVNFLLIFFLFREGSLDSKENKEISFSWKEGLKVLRPNVIYLLYFFLAVYFAMQINILPYYFERIDKIPPHLGWALTLNSVLIVFSQRHVTKIFKLLEEKMENLAIATGFASIGLSFLILKTDPYYYLFPFIVFLTFGEMLIGPHIDFLITTKVIVSKQFVFALTGVMFALGRTLSESGGITGLENLRLLGHNNLWWYFDAILAAGITFGILVFSRQTQFLTKKGGESMNSEHESIDIDQLEEESGDAFNTIGGG